MRSAWRDDVDDADRVDAFLAADSQWHGSPVNRTVPRQPVIIPLEELLAFEAQWTRHTAAKEEAILALGVRPARYYQLLRYAIRTREALEANPVLVNRLRSQMDARAAARASRSFARPATS